MSLKQPKIPNDYLMITIVKYLVFLVTGLRACYCQCAHPEKSPQIGSGPHHILIDLQYCRTSL